MKVKSKQNGRRRNEGIVEAALRLGVSRTHLYLVLRGERKSLRLMRRYRDLKRTEAPKCRAP